MQMVTNYIEGCFNDWSWFLDEQALDQPGGWAPLFGFLSVDPLEDGNNTVISWRAKCVLSCIEGASDFWWRLVLPCRRYPRRMLWMIKNPATDQCKIRLEVANEMLVADNIEGLDNSEAAWRFRNMFLHVSQGIVDSHGRMNQDVWCLLADISSVWRLDTQDIEGVNSLINK